MKNRSLTTLAALALAGASFSAAYASDTALVDALVKKGVLKQSEAEKILADSRKSGGDSASKIKLNDNVKELSIYGDLRLRWQHAQANYQADDNAGVYQNQEPRVRLQLGTRVKLTDDITVGVEVSTFNTTTQRYNTLGRGGDLNLGFSKAYINWAPSSEFSVTAGRQAVPFYSTEMVWDKDVRLDGVSEKVDLGKLLGLGDGLGLKLVAGQFIAGDNLAFNAKTALDNQDGWFYQTQLQISADLGAAKVTFAPGFLFSNGSTGNFGVNGKELLGFGLVGGLPGSVNGVNPNEDMATVLLPGDISFDVAGVNTKFYWDFAYNYNTSNLGVVGNPSTDKRFAYLVGIRAGQNKAAGDLSASVSYRQVGAQAVNWLYSDSDFGLGQLNQRGFKIAASYNLTNNTTISAAYSFTNNVDKDGVTGFSGVNGSAILSSTQLITIDLGVKF